MPRPPRRPFVLLSFLAIGAGIASPSPSLALAQSSPATQPKPSPAPPPAPPPPPSPPSTPVPSPIPAPIPPPPPAVPGGGTGAGPVIQPAPPDWTGPPLKGDPLQRDLRDVLPIDPWYPGSHADAVAEAKRRNRFLIVFSYERGSDVAQQMFASTFRNPTLYAWILWHGILIKVQRPRGPFESRTLTDVFVDGQHLRRIPHEDYVDHRGILQYGRTRTATAVLHNLDDIYQGIKSTNPIWAARHDQLNPEPKPPPAADPLHSTNDGLAKVVRDIEPGSGEDALARLAQARQARRTGDLSLATGLYTWLWERGADAEPAFDALRVTVVADDMRDLARVRADSLERFGKLRDAPHERWLWLDFAQMDAWMVISSVAADNTLKVAFFDMMTGDSLHGPQEGSMLPRADKLAYDAMLRRPKVGTPLEGRALEDALTIAADLLRDATRLKPKSIANEDWPALQTFRRKIAVSEVVRVIGPLLALGRDPEARALADQAASVAPGPTTRRAIVLAALAADQPRDWMRQYLAAAGAEPDRPGEASKVGVVPLHTRLDNALAEQAALRGSAR